MMNQMEIRKKIDELISKSESEIEELFAKRLESILFTISEIYRKYSVHGKDPSYTDLNKYNRLQKELKMINKMMNDDYKEIVKTLEKAQQTIYIDNYLLSAYLFEMTSSVDMGFTIPSIDTIKQALLNPIEFLTLPKVLEYHRNETIRRINIEITQGFISGEGYSDMALRIQNAVGFSRKKAMLVARTEGGRTRSVSNEAVAEQAGKYVKLGKVWMSSLDLRVRFSHRVLDGQKADGEGYFHYNGKKAKGPHLWGAAEMDINCRCGVLQTVNGMLPEYRRGRDYMDPEYQKKLVARIEQLMVDEDLTYLKAFNKAQKQIKPPSVTMEYISYDKWSKKFAS